MLRSCLRRYEVPQDERQSFFRASRFQTSKAHPTPVIQADGGGAVQDLLADWWFPRSE